MATCAAGLSHRMRAEAKIERQPDPEWDQACKIALCAASTHLSLVRHFNWVHLAGGAQLAIATRNSLSARTIRCSGCCGHTFTAPCRATTWSPGDRWYPVATSRPPSASLSRACATYSTTPTRQYQHSVNDPEKDGNCAVCAVPASRHRRRTTWRQLFDVMHQFVLRLSEDLLPAECHRRQQTCATTNEMLAWLDELKGLFPTELASTRKCHLGRFRADAGRPTVLGDRAARDPRQFHVELSAVDTPPAGPNIQDFRVSRWTFTSAWSTRTTS